MNPTPTLAAALKWGWRPRPRSARRRGRNWPTWFGSMTNAQTRSRGAANLSNVPSKRRRILRTGSRSGFSRPRIPTMEHRASGGSAVGNRTLTCSEATPDRRFRGRTEHHMFRATADRRFRGRTDIRHSERRPIDEFAVDDDYSDRRPSAGSAVGRNITCSERLPMAGSPTYGSTPTGPPGPHRRRQQHPREAITPRRAPPPSRGGLEPGHDVDDAAGELAFGARTRARAPRSR